MPGPTGRLGLGGTAAISKKVKYEEVFEKALFVALIKKGECKCGGRKVVGKTKDSNERSEEGRGLDTQKNRTL